jgi:hypothetical protein
VCFGFGIVGLLAAVPLSSRLNIGLQWSFLACLMGGVAAGYLLSIFLDVFLGNLGEPEH